MTDLTPLDAAHLTAEETQDPADRLAFWSRLAEAELSLLLATSAEEGQVTPQLFEVEGIPYALAFDTPLRLAAFAGEAPTATLPGRALARMLSDVEIGLALNLEGGPSAQLIQPDAIAWLSQMLARAPTEAEAQIEEIAAPGTLPDRLLTALDAKLPLAAGAARLAYLAQARLQDGTRTHVLAFVDPAPGAETQLAMAVQEALSLSGVEAGTLDVLFPAASDPLAASLARHGLRIDLPDAATRIEMGLADGDTDDDTPPRLR